MESDFSISLIYNLPVFAEGAGIPTENVDLSQSQIQEGIDTIFSALKQISNASVFGTDGNVEKLFSFLNLEKPDLVFNLCESVGHDASKEMCVASMYELMSINYTGSNALTLGTLLNKSRVKEILSYHKIPTPKFFVAKLNSKKISHNLQFPLIVKPLKEDASIAIENESVVKNQTELFNRIKYIHTNFNQDALVEEFIDGREINVAILGNGENINVLPLSEIEMTSLPENFPKIVTYNAKWMKGTIEFENTIRVCPVNIEQKLIEKIHTIALESYEILSLRDYARVDMRIDKFGNPFVLEINPNPDLSTDAGFVAAANVFGLTYEKLIESIVNCAIEREKVFCVN